MRSCRLNPMLVCLCLLLPVAARAQAVSALPRPTDYVSDLAQVIDANDRDELGQVCQQLKEKANAEVAIVTVNSLNGEPIEQYATELEDAWKVGGKTSDRGMILLIAPSEHKYRFEVGRGLEGVLNDAKVGDIGRSIVPQLKSGQYGAAALEAVETAGQEIAADAGTALVLPTAPMANDDAPVTVEQPAHHDFGGLLVLLIIGGVFLLILFAVAASGGGLGGPAVRTRRNGYNDDGWGGGGGGFGGFSGGGDIGGGDSGGSGGGDGFSGFGGGGSDGGGASGSW